MSGPFLSMKKISKSFSGVQVLKDVDFDIMRGEIHCLAGENGSGKSTLVKIISGVYQPDAGGCIEIDGASVRRVTSIDAIRHGIQVIYQDLSLFPTISVAENIAISQIISQGRNLVGKGSVRALATKAAARIGVDLPFDEPLGNLSMADQQLVAICRAFTSDVKLLIMDEPTTALSRKEVDALFRVIKDLQKSGTAALFISHKLDEVFDIAERVTILRDGAKIGTFDPSELDDARLSFLMTGMSPVYDPIPAVTGEGVPLLEIEGLSKRDNFRDISLSLRHGEVLGVTGLLGSGRTELALALFGLNPAEDGTILMDGCRVGIRNVREAMRNGIAYVPENRLLQGLVMHQSVAKNLLVTVLRRTLTKCGLTDSRRNDEQVARWIQDYKIKAPSADAPIETLSGGNQQRVVLAKWIATDPKVLILDGPTVGIDIAAKCSIYAIIRNLASQGMGIIIISDEVNELIHTCNRILVMGKGRIKKEFFGEKMTFQAVSRAIAGDYMELEQ
jgi:simple sugar transport system ATP-binding protein